MSELVPNKTTISYADPKTVKLRLLSDLRELDPTEIRMGLEVFDTYVGMVLPSDIGTIDLSPTIRFQWRGIEVVPSEDLSPLSMVITHTKKGK